MLAGQCIHISQASTGMQLAKLTRPVHKCNSSNQTMHTYVYSAAVALHMMIGPTTSMQGLANVLLPVVKTLGILGVQLGVDDLMKCISICNCPSS